MTATPDVMLIPFVQALASHGDRTAVITTDGRFTYRELAQQVAEMALRLGDRRRLILLAGVNRLDVLVAYLAALAGGHPLLLVPGDNATAITSLIQAYDPDVVIRHTDGRLALDERHATSRHELHPELALLLSTSGSTGSPKLVRLSHENLQANAEAIATSLGIRDSDRAATTLPLHYCYGLSVINSHLLRGAALILTDLSVADPCFWDLFRAARGTTLAGVPYTFELLDRVGFAAMRLPHLRYVTQAGGRLDPEQVARYAALGRQRGWDLFVMYGQTEATARMAYLPPHLAATRPQTIGAPIPGGSFQLRPLPEWEEPDTGELVYRGPNVMLGYAEHPADLALGRTVHELHTGDIARKRDDGLYEIVGRSSRFAKILGLRIDPQRVEAMLRRHQVIAYCLGEDKALVVAVAGEDPDRVQRLVAAECGVPKRAVRVQVLPQLPRLPNGKPDYQAVLRAVCATSAPAAKADARPDQAALDRISSDQTGLCQLYAEVLDRTGVTEEDSFVSLGGDSLSYVEMSVRLEQRLGDLPAGWHTMPIRELRPPAAGHVRHRRTLETSIALRAAAIVLIVGSHIPVFHIKGGAHLLLAIAGFNFARFQLTSARRRERVRGVWRGIGRIVLPAMLWISLALVFTRDYTVANLFLLNSILGPHDGRTEWQFWFVEALVYILIAAATLLTVPTADRIERRFPFWLPMAIAALGLVTRYDLPGLKSVGHVPSAVTVFWLFALGWAAARAATVGQRAVVTAAAALTVPGFFGEPWREALIIAGFALLVWVPRVPSLGVLNRLASVLASSSLYLYLTHWQVFPAVASYSRPLALIVSLATGIGYAALASRLARLLPSVRRVRVEAPAPFSATTVRARWDNPRPS